jgi:hypothetical protein
MFSSVSFWFRGFTAPVQAFGKLPFYKDYLRWISSAASEDWRCWLVSNYPEEVHLAEAMRPFIFMPASEAPIAVGQIEPSNDGIRDFPFSLFVILDRGVQKTKFFGKIIPCIWDAIGQARNEIQHCEDVEQFNHLIRKKMVMVRKDEIREKNPFQTNKIRLECHPSDSYPKLFIFNPE